MPTYREMVIDAVGATSSSRGGVTFKTIRQVARAAQIPKASPTTRPKYLPTTRLYHTLPLPLNHLLL